MAVKAMKRSDGVPHGFYMEVRQVQLKDGGFAMGRAVRLELSASSHADRQCWGRALLSWQRYYWRDAAANAGVDPEASSSTSSTSNTSTTTAAAWEDALRSLTTMVAQYEATKATSSRYSSCRHRAASWTLPDAAKQPLSLLRRKSASLRRSLSFVFPTAGSEAATATAVAASMASPPPPPPSAVYAVVLPDDNKSNQDEDHEQDHTQPEAQEHEAKAARESRTSRPPTIVQLDHRMLVRFGC